MEYTVIINGRSYDLPKKNISVMEQLDAVLKVDQLKIRPRQKFEKVHAFLKDMLGEEHAKELVGSDSLDEIDLSELSIAVLKINDAYNQPLTDYRIEKIRATMSNMQTDKFTALANSASTISNLSGAANG